MVWNPSKQVIDVSPVVTNLLAYIASNQTDALIWANGGAGLADFAKFYPSASGRLGSIFPHLMVIDQEDEGEDAETENGDVLLTGLRLRLEGAVTGADADELAVTAKIYDTAVKSMLVNIPGATLTGSQATNAYPIQMGTVFDVVGKYKTSYIQVWQTSIIYKLIASAF